MQFINYEKFIKLFSSIAIDIKKDLQIKFNKENTNNITNSNSNSNYQCNFLIYFFRNFEKIEKEFSINYFPNENKNVTNLIFYFNY